MGDVVINYIVSGVLQIDGEEIERNMKDIDYVMQIIDFIEVVKVNKVDYEKIGKVSNLVHYVKMQEKGYF